MWTLSQFLRFNDRILELYRQLFFYFISNTFIVYLNNFFILKEKAMAADNHKNANIGFLSRKLKITGTIWLENCSLRSESIYFVEYHSLREKK